MNQIEENIVRSFRLAKNDIIDLQKKVIELGAFQEKIMEIILETKDKEGKLYQKVMAMKNPNVVKQIKVVSKKAQKQYVASKNGKKFHIKECPFAQNIKPKSKTVFKSKVKALNEGYKACNCVK